MADYYDKLTDQEKAYWDIYTRLRQLSDWKGFTPAQESVKNAARDWLTEQRKKIWRSAQSVKNGGDGHGWSYHNRAERFAQLKDESLNVGTPRRLVQLPTNGCTPGEKAAISEREMWWRVPSVDDATKAWRLQNANLVTKTRQQLYTLGKTKGWDKAERELRYNNLCICTKTGIAFKEWSASHDPNTGGFTQKEIPSQRANAVSHARTYVGTTESPPGTNRGPMVSLWQRRVLGTDGNPWCACFATCMVWDVGVKGASSGGVVVCKDMAKQAVGIFRGYTTNPREVLRGDFAIIGCSTCHIGLVADSDNPYHLIEGNTSPSTAGSQYNGGCVAEKTRPENQVVGWCLVDFSD